MKLIVSFEILGDNLFSKKIEGPDEAFEKACLLDI